MGYKFSLLRMRTDLTYRSIILTLHSDYHPTIIPGNAAVINPGIVQRRLHVAMAQHPLHRHATRRRAGVEQQGENGPVAGRGDGDSAGQAAARFEAVSPGDDRVGRRGMQVFTPPPADVLGDFLVHCGLLAVEWFGTGVGSETILPPGGVLLVEEIVELSTARFHFGGVGWASRRGLTC